MNGLSMDNNETTPAYSLAEERESGSHDDGAIADIGG